MCAITQVSQPCLESRRVVLPNLLPLGDYARVAGNGRPFAEAVEKAKIDLGVCFDVVGLAGLGVGVEE